MQKKIKFYFAYIFLLIYNIGFSQQINDEFLFDGNLKAAKREKYLTKLLSNSKGNFIQDYVKVGTLTKQVYNKSQSNDGLVYTIDNINDFNDYTFNIVYFMPPYSSYNRLQMFGNLEEGVYRYGTGLNIYYSGINDSPSLLPKSGFNYTHLGISRNGSTNSVKIYINGEFYKEYINSSNALKNQSDKKFTFFKDNGCEENIAKVAYLNVANYVQSAEEISALFKKATEAVVEEKYLFLNNLNNDESTSNLSNTSSSNYTQIYDPICQINRNALLISSNDQLSFTNTSQFNLDYTFIFKIKPSSNTHDISLIDFSNDTTNRKISLINKKLYLGGVDSQITINQELEDGWIDLAITRNDENDIITVYNNNRSLGTFTDSDKKFQFLNNRNASISKVNDDTTNALSLFKFSSKVLNLSEINNEFDVICNSSINNTFEFQQSLNNLSNANQLKVTSIDNSHTSNNYMTSTVSDCNTSKYIYNANPKTKITYNNGYGMFYYNYTINFYLQHTNTSLIKLISFDESNNGIYQNANQIILKNSVGEYPFEIPNYDSQKFYLLSLIKNGTSKEIKVYVNEDFLGSFIDTTNELAVNTNGDINLLNNTVSNLSSVKIRNLNISNSLETLDRIKIILNNFCPKIINDLFEFDGNLNNKSTTKILNLTPTSSIYNPQNFYTDINTNCGNRKYFYTLNEGEGFDYEDKDYFAYENYTINLYFKLDSPHLENQLIKFDHNKSISLQNGILYFTSISSTLAISSAMNYNYNMLTVVKNPGYLNIYLNGNYIGQIADPNNYFSFPKQSSLKFFNDKKVYIGEFGIENRAYTASEIFNNFKNLCFKNIDRIFPMFINLKDSSDENELTPT